MFYYGSLSIMCLHYRQTLISRFLSFFVLFEQILTESFILAVVGSPFGVDGFVKIKSLSGEIGHLASLKNVILRQYNTEKSFSIEETRPLDDASWLLIKFSGVNNPETAKALTGAQIIADRSGAAPLNPGEFYIEDLKGLSVISAINPDEPSGGEVFGSITDIIEGGNGELAEVKLLSGIKKLVPFRNEFFGKISLKEKTAVLLNKWILEE